MKSLHDDNTTVRTVTITRESVRRQGLRRIEHQCKRRRYVTDRQARFNDCRVVGDGSWYAAPEVNLHSVEIFTDMSFLNTHFTTPALDDLQKQGWVED